MFVDLLLFCSLPPAPCPSVCWAASESHLSSGCQAQSAHNPIIAIHMFISARCIFKPVDVLALCTVAEKKLRDLISECSYRIHH